jgi:hypothetical protein
MQTEQRETRQIQREEKRARALETSLTRAEIEDQSVRFPFARDLRNEWLNRLISEFSRRKSSSWRVSRMRELNAS